MKSRTFYNLDTFVDNRIFYMLTVSKRKERKKSWNFCFQVQDVVRDWIQGETWHSRQIPFSGKAIKVGDGARPELPLVSYFSYSDKK